MSHGIGLGFFGLINLLLARHYPQLLYESAWLLPAMSATYLTLSITCWFYAPAIHHRLEFCVFLACSRSVAVNHAT